MMTVEEKVIQILRRLPDMRQQEILDFAEFLVARDEPFQPKIGMLEPLLVLTGFVPQGWKEAVYDDKI